MTNDLFDMSLRAQRRDRAFRAGPELFLYDRVFSDLLERLHLVRRKFQSALLIGCPDRAWKECLQSRIPQVAVVDPGALFAQAAGGTQAIEERLAAGSQAHDLCIAIGTLDTVNDLPTTLRLIRSVLRPDSLFIGALPGGDNLPQLRSSMRAADEAMGAASPHIHPRIEASALAMLLQSAGFTAPVIDVSRIDVAYRTLGALVRDLRAMGATNVLKQRSANPLSRKAAQAAAEHFAAGAEGGRTIERFELLHFAAWSDATET